MNKSILNHNVNELTKQLHDICLERADAIENLDKINKAETDTLRKIEEARYIEPKGGNCTFIEGDILHITSHLRDEYGTVGTVKKVRKTLVTIRNSGTGSYYQRVWWNIELIKTADDTCPRKRQSRK